MSYTVIVHCVTNSTIVHVIHCDWLILVSCASTDHIRLGYFKYNVETDWLRVSAVNNLITNSIVNWSLPNSEHRLPDKWCTNCTIYSQNRFTQCACAATDFCSNKVSSFINGSGRNFSLIFIKFGTRIAEVSDRKRKYFAHIAPNFRVFALYTVFHV